MTAERPLNPLEVEAIRSSRSDALLMLANSLAELRGRYQMRWGISTPGDWQQAGMVWTDIHIDADKVLQSSDSCGKMDVLTTFANREG